MHLQFRKATSSEIPQIWEILQKAIQRRKEDGSNQWQDGYPNPIWFKCSEGSLKSKHENRGLCPDFEQIYNFISRNSHISMRRP